jgi:hypothetical protein
VLRSLYRFNALNLLCAMSRMVFASMPVFAKRWRSGSGRLSVSEEEESRGTRVWLLGSARGGRGVDVPWAVPAAAVKLL